MDGVMSELVSYDRRPEDLPEEIALTVRAIIEITGKSIRTLISTISFLKLSSKELSAPSHPVSIAMKKMQTVPEVRIIEGLNK